MLILSLFVVLGLFGWYGWRQYVKQVSRDSFHHDRAADVTNRLSSFGFSLIELLIVVAIIMILSAIAIPNLVRSRIAANQVSCIQTLRMLNVVQMSAMIDGRGYSPDLLTLGPSVDSHGVTGHWGLVEVGSIWNQLVDVSSFHKSGYTFQYQPGSVESMTNMIHSYSIVAIPLDSSSGLNSYFTDQSGVIRVNATTSAASTDAPVGG